MQSLLLFTTVTTMYVAGDPSLGLIFLTCLGGALSAGGAGAINHAVDRDIDRTMARTADRPVAPAGSRRRPRSPSASPSAAASFLLLSLTVNPLAATLSLSGFVGYVCVYTLWLKRTHAAEHRHRRRRRRGEQYVVRPCYVPVLLDSVAYC